MYYFIETILGLSLLVSWVLWLMSIVPALKRLSWGDCSAFEASGPRTSVGGTWSLSWWWWHVVSVQLCFAALFHLSSAHAVTWLPQSQAVFNSHFLQARANVIFHFQPLHFPSVIVCSSLELMIGLYNCLRNQGYSGGNGNRRIKSQESNTSF